MSTGPKAEAWCLLMHADASLYLLCLTSERLKLTCDHLVSNVAFNFDSCRYMKTLKEAVDTAFEAYMGDPVTQFYAIGSVVGRVTGFRD
jgi:tryptophan synthase beta subunit